LIVDPVFPDGDVLASFASCGLGNHSLDHLRQKVLPRLTIFNAANEKDAFAASLPETQDSTIDAGRRSYLPATWPAEVVFWTTFSQRTF
jgi:hypothetical protein